MQIRRRVKQTNSLKDRLEGFARDARQKAMEVVGAERNELLKNALTAETAAHIKPIRQACSHRNKLARVTASAGADD